MKRTEYVLGCGTKNGHEAYRTAFTRTVFTDGERYYVKWNEKVIDVTENKASFRLKTFIR